MNWDIVEGNWKQFKGQVKAPWSKLTHDHHDVIVCKRVELAAKIQEASPETECKRKEEIPPRRLVLRGALVLGCSPWVPIALVGCDSNPLFGVASELMHEDACTPLARECQRPVSAA